MWNHMTYQLYNVHKYFMIINFVSVTALLSRSQFAVTRTKGHQQTAGGPYSTILVPIPWLIIIARYSTHVTNVTWYSPYVSTCLFVTLFQHWAPGHKVKVLVGGPLHKFIFSLLWRMFFTCSSSVRVWLICLCCVRKYGSRAQFGSFPVLGRQDSITTIVYDNNETRCIVYDGTSIMDHNRIRLTYDGTTTLVQSYTIELNKSSMNTGFLESC